MVRCGRCMSAFDALETLSDGEVEGSAYAVEARAEKEEAVPAGAELAAQDEPATVGPRPGASEPPAGAAQPDRPPDRQRRDWEKREAREPIAREPIAGEPIAGEPIAGEPIAGEPIAGEPIAGEPIAGEPSARMPPPDSVPEFLREDLGQLARAGRRRRERYVFSVLSMLMLFTLALQYAWFMPEDMERRYPQSRPFIDWFCAQTSCPLPERRDASKVQIVSRDVRVHPHYEGALLVTASLVNAADFEQPYPRMQFTLFNVNGQTIATRTFEPEQYLPPEVDAQSGMPPERPVQVALDMLAPDEAAVSFEFRFL